MEEQSNNDSLEERIVLNIDHLWVIEFLCGYVPFPPGTDEDLFYHALANRLDEIRKEQKGAIMNKDGKEVNLTSTNLRRVRELYSKYDRYIPLNNPDYKEQGRLVLHFMRTAPLLPYSIAEHLLSVSIPIKERAMQITTAYNDP
jgi:hypothetical protein